MRVLEVNLTMGLREGRGLLPWVIAPQLQAIYRATSVTEPTTFRQFSELWKRRQKAAAALTLQPAASASEVADIPATLSFTADAVVEGDIYHDHYGALRGRVARIPLPGLVTPQWSVDWEYVIELATIAPSVGDEAAIFDYCFAVGDLGEANVVAGQLGVVRTIRHQPPHIHPVRMTRTARRVTFSVEVEARPAYVHVANVMSPDFGSRLVIMDGVHRLTALLDEGHTHAYGLVVDIPVQQVGAYFNQGQPGMIVDGVTAPRPPRIDDFLDSTVYDTFTMDVLDVVVRIAMQSEPVPVPAGSVPAELPLGEVAGKLGAEISGGRSVAPTRLLDGSTGDGSR